MWRERNKIILALYLFFIFSLKPVFALCSYPFLSYMSFSYQILSLPSQKSHLPSYAVLTVRANSYTLSSSSHRTLFVVSLTPFSPPLLVMLQLKPSSDHALPSLPKTPSFSMNLSFNCHFPLPALAFLSLHAPTSPAIESLLVPPARLNVWISQL